VIRHSTARGSWSVKISVSGAGDRGKPSFIGARRAGKGKCPCYLKIKGKEKKEGATGPQKKTKKKNTFKGLREQSQRGD